jgi:hypothetical protein
MTTQVDLQIPTSKAALLIWLYGRLEHARVPMSVLVTRRQWDSQAAAVVTGIREQFGYATNLIVRSSAAIEDQTDSTQAGRFLTVPNVVHDNELRIAIDNVFASYGTVAGSDLLFVQRMLQGASTVGVAFTAEPATGSPYLVVTYAENEGTDAITSGAGNHSTWIAIADGLASPPTEDLGRIPPLIDELNALLQWKAIDIEFAVVDGTPIMRTFASSEISTPISSVEVAISTCRAPASNSVSTCLLSSALISELCRSQGI